jgi:hypothetical protein
MSSNTTRTRVSIIFPYLGDDDGVRDRLLQMLEAALNRRKYLHTCNQKPILVVNKDTIRRGLYEKFEKYVADNRENGSLLDQLDILDVWSVDTCQMWLAAFGKVLDDTANNPKDDTRCVLQIPGDLKYVADFGHFLNQLGRMRSSIETDWDFAVGDFEVDSRGSKYLIDMYGTYPLLFNWFPDIARSVREMEIQRPRSEFLAARVEFLSEMLKRRKFAYEQTIVFLLHAFSDNLRRKPRGEPPRKRRAWDIGKVDLGKVADYAPGRGFREANDQIQRTERMLKFLWREFNGGDKFDVREFERLEARSTAICRGAMVSLENFLR